MGLQESVNPAQCPVVSTAPAGRLLPKEGHSLEAVGGTPVTGGADAYAKAVELVTSASRPVTLVFRDATTATKQKGQFDVTFSGARLGVALAANANPTELPHMSADPSDGSDAKGVVKSGDLVHSVNGTLLEGSPDTYAKAIEVIQAAGRPLTIRFQRPSYVAALAESSQAAGGGGVDP